MSVQIKHPNYTDESVGLLMKFANIAANLLSVDANKIIIHITTLNQANKIQNRSKIVLGELAVHIDHYEVMISESVEPKLQALAICHEFIHVLQYESSVVQNLPNGWMWNDAFYPSNTPYDERPWEIEAKAKEGDLLIKVLKYFR